MCTHAWHPLLQGSRPSRRTLKERSTRLCLLGPGRPAYAAQPGLPSPVGLAASWRHERACSCLIAGWPLPCPPPADLAQGPDQPGRRGAAPGVWPQQAARGVAVGDPHLPRGACRARRPGLACPRLRALATSAAPARCPSVRERLCGSAAVQGRAGTSRGRAGDEQRSLRLSPWPTDGRHGKPVPPHCSAQLRPPAVHVEPSVLGHGGCRHHRHRPSGGQRWGRAGAGGPDGGA